MRASFLLALCLGCVVPDLSIEGHACPCPDGYTCDSARQVCIQSAAGGVGAGGGGAEPVAAGGTGGTTTGPCAGVCGGPGCGECPSVAVIDAGGFGVDALEATRGDYQRFLADAVDPTTQAPWCQWNTSFQPDPAGLGCPETYDFSQPGFPITCVDWCDAAAFCAWSGKRLCGRKGGGTVGGPEVNDPTKSEWFAACSADGTLDFPYGNTVQTNACNTLGNGAAVVGAGWFAQCEGGYPGLFDMVGNVEEWEDACEITGDSAGDNCQLRGGAFWADAATPTKDYARCSSNLERAPDRDAAAHDWGFRCCTDL